MPTADHTTIGIDPLLKAGVVPNDVSVVAVGGELKDSICTLQGGKAKITSSLGALTDAAVFRQFLILLEEEVSSVEGRIDAIAHDLHPAFLSTETAIREAAKHETNNVPVQHHHAHVAACMAESGIVGPAIGISCDGTGYGTDGAIWGCEILNCTYSGFTRAGHLAYFPLAGGDLAAIQTWRPAMGLVHRVFGESPPDEVLALFERVPSRELRAVSEMLASNFNCAETSSLGRLFDAVAFLAGVRDSNEFEGQAAIELEKVSVEGPSNPYPYQIRSIDGARQIDVSPMIKAICTDACAGVESAEIGGRFHSTVATMLAEVAIAAAQEAKVDTVVLTGGCFLNKILTSTTEKLLASAGIAQVAKHNNLSPGDASLSLGQACIAAALRS